MYNDKISLPVKQNDMKYHGTEAPPCIRMEGSYMVELAVALPFFAGFMAVLLFFFQVLTVQQEVGNALLAAGRELSVLACGRDMDDAGMAAFARMRLLAGLKGDSAASGFVRHGSAGIALTQSDFSGDYIFLQADYRVRLPIGLFGTRDIRMTQKIKCRKWTGRQEGGGTKEEIVYITPGGSVYHRTRDCSFISPSVSGASLSGIGRLRNQDGGKYYPCETCMNGAVSGKSTVYITKYGDRYHGRRDCSRINHTVYAVRLSEAKDRRVCSKCGRE